MIPIPRGGRLDGVEGREAAEAVPGVEEVELSIPLGHEVVPPPEGSRYLGFIFARLEASEAVEEALREAHGRLKFIISPLEEDSEGGLPYEPSTLKEEKDDHIYRGGQDQGPGTH